MALLETNKSSWVVEFQPEVPLTAFVVQLYAQEFWYETTISSRAISPLYEPPWDPLNLNLVTV